MIIKPPLRWCPNFMSHLACSKSCLAKCLNRFLALEDAISKEKTLVVAISGHCENFAKVHYDSSKFTPTSPRPARTSPLPGSGLAIKTNALFPYHFSEQFLPPAHQVSRPAQPSPPTSPVRAGSVFLCRPSAARHNSSARHTQAVLLRLESSQLDIIR